MSKVLTAGSIIVCAHQGTVNLQPSQSKLKVNGRQVLVKGDLDGATISGCVMPNAPAATPPTKPCQTVTTVIAGEATGLKVDSNPTLLETISGLTDGLPTPGATWRVQSAGQTKLDTK